MLRLLLPCLLLFPAVADAEAKKGVVALNRSGCDYYIVETVLGYSLLEWYGGNNPDKGDVIVGDIESYGMKDIFNITDDREGRVWVEDYWLGRDEVLRKYVEKCN